MWLKPVKSYSSALAFQVKDAEQFDDAVSQIREGIGGIGEAFDVVLSMLDLPPEVAEAGGQHACLAEEEISGRQLTVEGYSIDGKVHCYGVVDSIQYEGTSSFLRYQYPSSVPADIADRLIDASSRVVRQIGLDNSTFNIEFFWDPERDRINIVEVNPRLSQSHAPLFEYVDGVPNHECMISLALGRAPQLPYRKGSYNVAGKWFLRRFSDGYVRKSPSEEDIARVEREVPDTIVDITATQGGRLSDLPSQDSYSYELAALYIGAQDEDELKRNTNAASNCCHSNSTSRSAFLATAGFRPMTHVEGLRVATTEAGRRLFRRVTTSAPAVFALSVALHHLVVRRCHRRPESATRPPKRCLLHVAGSHPFTVRARGHLVLRPVGYRWARPPETHPYSGGSLASTVPALDAFSGRGTSSTLEAATARVEESALQAARCRGLRRTAPARLEPAPEVDDQAVSAVPAASRGARRARHPSAARAESARRLRPRRAVRPTDAGAREDRRSGVRTRAPASRRDSAPRPSPRSDQAPPGGHTAHRAPHRRRP